MSASFRLTFVLIGRSISVVIVRVGGGTNRCGNAVCAGGGACGVGACGATGLIIRFLITFCCG